MKILQLTAHFRPNIGGVETHLNDLCKVLLKNNFDITVLTYRPLQTKVPWEIIEKEKNIEIIRIPWIPGFFYKLLSNPILEFIYLLPGLFFITPLILFFKTPVVIQAHGLVAGFVGVFWGRIFNRRIVITIHNIYSFPKKGLYQKFAKWIFENASFCLGLSKQSAAEIKSLGISPKKVSNFTYWIDLNNFQRVEGAKSKLDWEGKFVVLFVGRLVSEKGIDVLLESAKNWNKQINLKIIGSGPMEDTVKQVTTGLKNVQYLGSVTQRNLPVYYSGSDILIVPSVSEEGFGRVILESLACGTPVVGAKRGAIPEVLEPTVGKVIDINAENIKESLEYFFTHKDKLIRLANNCRKFAERRYSEKNADAIIKTYIK